jgi:hypothetical protein
MLLEGTCGRSTREVSPCVVRAHRSQPRARAVSTQPQPEQSVSSRATGLAGSRMQAERRTLYMLKAARRAHGALTQVQGYQGAWQTGSTLHPSVCEN